MNKTLQKRRPRLRRHRFSKIPFVLQDRDREIVRTVVEHRLISSCELLALLPGSKQVILRRLQALFHAGIVDRPRAQRLMGNAPMAYAPGVGANRVIDLACTGHKSTSKAESNRLLRPGYLEHGLMISRFRTALTLACRAAGSVEIACWIQGTDIWDHVVVSHSDWEERIPVCPDSYFVLMLRNEPEGRNRIHLFLEADRSTMTVKRYLTKLRGYWAYWRSGRLEKRYGARNVLVLTLTTTAERATNLLNAANDVDPPEHRGLRMFMFTAEDQFSIESPEGILKAIWKVPGEDYRHSLTE